MVEDNGIGFDNKYIDNIFRIFRRLHTSQSEYEGKGIGLAICQRIMTNHEGYIIGTGTTGEGAKFKLYFPACPYVKSCAEEQNLILIVTGLCITFVA